MFKIDVLGTSWELNPPNVNLGLSQDIFRVFLQNPKAIKQVTLAHIWWNKIENNAVKMHLYDRFKIKVLGTSQGRHPTDVFSGRFEMSAGGFSKTLRISNS